MNLVDQMDEQLKRAQCNQIFKETFCGNLTNQVVCKDCPHRYDDTLWIFNYNEHIYKIKTKERL